MRTETGGAARETARRAFDAYARALETGDPGPLADLADDGVTFMVTIPQAGRKVRTGKAELGNLARWRWDELRLRPRTVALDGVTEGEGTVGFEYRLEGALGGEPYRTHAVVFFDVAGDRVTGFREYDGDSATPAEFFEPIGLEPVFREAYPGQGEAKRGKPPTLATTDRIPASGETLDVARRAFDAFELSCREGEWRPFLGLMYEGVSFTLPIPGRMRGKGQGIAEVAEYHRWRWEDLRMRTPVFERKGATANGETVAFEFRIDGTVGDGMPTRHPAVYFVDVRGGKVVGFREYNGDEEDAKEA